MHVLPPSQYLSCPVSFSVNQIYSEESPVVIFDALAGHLHQVQIRARDEVNAESQWSEWSPLLLARPWEGQKETLQLLNIIINADF